MEDESMKITLVNDEGQEVECDVLFTFENEETGKNYIVYTDNTEDEDGNTQVYASIYDPGGDGSKLYPIETEEEWRAVETLLDKIMDDLDESDD